MPSYVLAAQEIAPTNKKNTTNIIKTDSTSITVHHYNSAISPQRNLSLNLSPQYVDVQQSEHQKQQQYQQQLGQKATRSNKQLKAPVIKFIAAAANPTTTDAKFTTKNKMLANVSNNLVGAIGSDEAYSERALLLRGAENVAGSGAMQQLLHTTATTTTTTTTTITTHNNNQNSFNLRTIPKKNLTTTTTNTTKVAHNNNNIRNNYGSTLIARNIVDGGGGSQGDSGIIDVHYLQTTDDDMPSDVAPTTNAGTVAVSVNDNDKQKNSQYQTRQNVTTTTTTTTNTNKKTKMSKLGSKNVGLKR